MEFYLHFYDEEETYIIGYVSLTNKFYPDEGWEIIEYMIKNNIHEGLQFYIVNEKGKKFKLYDFLTLVDEKYKLIKTKK
jgi:hypothetical protein